jgi:ribosomal protein S18 acetylase RimI-like enzyme
MNVPWKPSSLFLRSEFIFWRKLSIIEDIGDALVISTPQNPYWRWGNLILLKNPPRMEDVVRWRELYETKIAPNQVNPNRIILWDGASADSYTTEEFRKDNLIFSPFDILTLNSLKQSPNHNNRIAIQEIGDNDEEWREVIESNIESFGPTDAPDYRHYAERRMADHRLLISKGYGRWYTARFDGELVGSLGIFAGDGLCRFQEVAVRPKFQRQGIASSLVYHAAAGTREEYPNSPQVIVADPDGGAINVYRQIGFEKHSESHALITPR